MHKNFNIRLFLLTLLITAAVGCAPAQKAKNLPARPKPEHPEHTDKQDKSIDGYKKLSLSVVPAFYKIDLTVDPSKDKFSGKIQINVQITHDLDKIYLHAENIKILNAHVVAEEKKTPARAVTGINGGLRLDLKEPAKKGPAALNIEFEAPLGKISNGLYRVKVKDRWYAYTQFEPFGARKAFPCFDQPEFKTPYQVTISTPGDNIALSNAPRINLTEKDSQKVFEFAKTKPLPTYLVAFAVGSFDIVEAEKDVASVPIRLVTTKDNSSLSDYVLQKTPVILKTLEEYFGQPHPYAKIDLVAVPNFAAGAMENVGLVTFREQFLLIDEERTSVPDKIRSLGIIAHELAHMWFGNLVTLEWWNDLWLNEGFATWMTTHVINVVAPEYERDLEAGVNARNVMNLDAQTHARSIRQPIKHGGDVFNAFDGITYGKGRAVLRMIEAWTGKEKFRQGVRNYIKKYAHKTATTKKLLDELDAATGKLVSETITMFLDQPGTPLISVTPVCDNKSVSLKLEQTRYLPAGSKASIGKPWRIPVCVSYPLKNKSVSECFILDKPQKNVPVKTKICPSWIHPNADERSYYRWKLPDKDMLSLLEHMDRLTTAEKIALPSHLAALLEAELLPINTYLDALAGIAEEKHRLIVERVISGLYKINSSAVDDTNRKPFAVYVNKLLGAHLLRTGTKSKPGENTDLKLIRPYLIYALAELGQSAALKKQAREYTDKLLDDPESVDLSDAGNWLEIAAWDGDQTLWERYVKFVADTKLPSTRKDVVRALGSFHNPKLLKKSLNLILHGTLLTQDFRTIAGSASSSSETRHIAWQWLKENYNSLVNILGKHAKQRLPWIGQNFCSNAKLDDLEKFFSDPDRSPPGTARVLGLATGYIKRCIRLKTTIAEPVTKYLNK